jgi:serine protease inhibitor
MSIWDKGGSFTRKKLSAVLCGKPNASRSEIDAALRDTDYDEITNFTDRLRIEGVIKEDMDTTADESGMFISSITSAIESAQGLQQTIQSKGENFDVPAWVQAKSALASDYLHSINRYYKGNPDQD